MKQTGGCFRERNPKPLTIQRFQDVQFLPFQQKRQKNRAFFSGFQAGGPAWQHRRLFQGRKPETAQLSGFKIGNSLPFNKAPKKTAHFERFSGPASQPHPLQQGCNRMGGNAVFCKGAMPAPNLG